MTERESTLTFGLQQYIDQVCDQFEAAWKAGQRPQIEEALGPTPAPARNALLRELARIQQLAKSPASSRNASLPEFQALLRRYEKS